jgi:dephospho-CoA kinase
MPHRHCKPVIGIIGGIGAGKSFVAKQFESLGCCVIDADKIAKQAYQDPAILDQLITWWGAQIRSESGSIDREKLAKIVFNHAPEMAKLEGVIHPFVHRQRERLRSQFLETPDCVAVIEDTPLLLEKGFESECDVLVFVDTPQSERETRVLETRGWSADQLEMRQKSQIGLDTKRASADYVVRNQGDEATCLDHVRQVLSRILKSY